MQIVVDTDFDFVDVVSLQHFTEVRIQIFFRDPILLAPCFQPVFFDFSCSNDCQVLTALLQVLDNRHVPVRDHAAADDRDSDFLHVILLYNEIVTVQHSRTRNAAVLYR